MNWLTVAFLATFGANALLDHGFGVRGALVPGRSRTGPATLGLFFAALVATLLFRTVDHLVLAPLGLREAFTLPVYLLGIVPLVGLLAAAVGGRLGSGLAGVLHHAREALVGSLALGIALVMTRADYSLSEALLGAAAAAAGYVLSRSLLDAIRGRMELSLVPPLYRSGSTLLLSAALLSMAFSVIGLAVKGMTTP